MPGLIGRSWLGEAVRLASFALCHKIVAKAVKAASANVIARVFLWPGASLSREATT